MIPNLSSRVLRLAAVAATCCLSAFSLRADDAKTAKTSYSGDISGVVCSSCKQHVQSVLMKNLADIVSVDVLPSDKTDVQKIVIVTSSNRAVTAESANKALGEDVKDYKVLSLEKK